MNIDDLNTYKIDSVSYEQLKGIIEADSEYNFIIQNMAIYTINDDVVVITNGSSAKDALANTIIWPVPLDTTDKLYVDLKKGELKYKLGDEKLRFKLL